MSNLFKTLEIEAFRAGITPRTRESREWFRQKAQQLRRVNRNQLMKEEELELRNRVGTKGNLVGNMYMFFYDPKLKKEKFTKAAIFNQSCGRSIAPRCDT